MGESLTPILTRDQYRKGYLSYLAKENSMNLMNLAANQTFAMEGETIGTLYSQSSTVSAIPREQKLAILAMKMQGYLKQPDLTIRQLPNNQLDFLYVGIDTIKQLMGASGVQLPIEDLMFRQYMSQLLVGAKDTASFKAAYGTPTPTPEVNAPNPNALVAPRIANDSNATGATGNDMNDHTADPGSAQVDLSKTQNDTTDEFLNVYAPNKDDLLIYSPENPETTLMSQYAPDPNATTIKSSDDDDVGPLLQPFGSPQQPGETLGQFLVRRYQETYNQDYKKKYGRSSGSGLKSALKKQQRTGKRGPRGRLILGEGLTPLGKHFLDTYDLENHNKVCIRYQGGKLVKAIPAKVVGGTVAGALKSIVKGKAPSALDVEKMTEDERNYLNLISSKAHVKQLQVPSKDKTAEEKLVHKFNTMKGEIIAGNDNKDLIKEFKLLLLKLKQMSKISKDDVNEILMDLAALGY